VVFDAKLCDALFKGLSKKGTVIEVHPKNTGPTYPMHWSRVCPKKEQCILEKFKGRIYDQLR